MSALGWPWGLGHRRNLPLVLKADKTQSQAPGPACPSLCPRPLLHESEHAHSACTRTSRWTWEDWTGGRAAAAMGRGHRAAGERTTRPTGAPGGGRSAPLPFTASSQWFHTPHLTPPHLIPEPGQMALLLAQSPPREGRRGLALGHPEPPTMFPEASSPAPHHHVPCQRPPVSTSWISERACPAQLSSCPGSPTTGRDRCLEVPSAKEEKA